MGGSRRGNPSEAFLLVNRDWRYRIHENFAPSNYNGHQRGCPRRCVNNSRRSLSLYCPCTEKVLLLPNCAQWDAPPSRNGVPNRVVSAQAGSTWESCSRAIRFVGDCSGAELLQSRLQNKHNGMLNSTQPTRSPPTRNESQRARIMGAFWHSTSYTVHGTHPDSGLPHHPTRIGYRSASLLPTSPHARCKLVSHMSTSGSVSFPLEMFCSNHMRTCPTLSG